MSQAQVNGIRIEYDTFGDRRGRPLFLIMGLASQMVGWHAAFCRKLVDRGHFVVRFDNRDVGLSSKIEEGGIPRFPMALMGGISPEQIRAPYTLSDMASDAVGLMDALGIDKAHMCGLSMGGMIAQTAAIQHPGRLLSLISMESTTGDMALAPPTPAAGAALFMPPPSNRQGYAEHMVKTFRILAAGSPAYDEVLQSEIFDEAFERSFYPIGFARQLAAVIASGNRTLALGSVKIPTLVIHGDIDPLLPVAHGLATAAAVPGAAIHIVKGLGHGIAFPSLWDEIVDSIAKHTERAV